MNAAGQQTHPTFFYQFKGRRKIHYDNINKQFDNRLFLKSRY